VYRDSVLLEAERQKTAIGHVDDWAIEFLKLTEDDVSTTLMQVFFFICQNHLTKCKINNLLSVIICI